MLRVLRVRVGSGCQTRRVREALRARRVKLRNAICSCTLPDNSTKEARRTNETFCRP